MTNKLLFGLLVTIFFQCHNKKNTDIGKDHESEKTAVVKEFIVKNFSMFFEHRYEAELDSQIAWNSSNTEFIIYPGPYKVKRYTVGEAFHYSPFAIRFSTLQDSLVTLFTFTDELYYMESNVKGHFYGGETIDIYPEDSARQYGKETLNFSQYFQRFADLVLNGVY